MKYIKLLEEFNKLLFYNISYNDYLNYNLYEKIPERDILVIENKFKNWDKKIGFPLDINSNSTIEFSSKNDPIDIIITYIQDDYYLVEYLYHLDHKIMDEHYKCDTIEGLLQLLKKYNIE